MQTAVIVFASAPGLAEFSRLLLLSLSLSHSVPLLLSLSPSRSLVGALALAPTGRRDVPTYSLLVLLFFVFLFLLLILFLVLFLGLFL